MARIRTIKPEFWSSERLGTRLQGPDGRQARLLFVALWTHAEDHGGCKGAPAYLKAAAFPYDEDVTSEDVRRWLALLEQGGFIVRYQRDGSQYVWIRGFAEHQKIDRPGKTTIPTPSVEEVEGRANARRGFDDDSTNARRMLDEASLLEGNGVERSGSSPASSASEPAQPAGQLSLVGNDSEPPKSSPTPPPLPAKRGHVPNAVSEWYEWAQAERKRQLGEDCPVSPLQKHQWAKLGEAVKLHGQELLKVAHRLFLGDEYARGQGYPTGLFVSRWEDWVGRAKASAPRPQHNLPIPAGSKPPVEQYAPGRPKLPTLEEARKLGMVK